MSSIETNSFFNKILSSMYLRAPTTAAILSLLNKRKPLLMVETGTTRKVDWAYDGCSTILYGKWAKENGAHLYSVDINEKAVAFAKQRAATLPVTVICDDSLNFLREFDRKVDFFYLDSYDYDKNNPLPSMQHCLEETKLALKLSHDNTIIAIDDFKGTIDAPMGKPGLALRYLLDNGWKVVSVAHQIVLVRVQQCLQGGMSD